MIISKEEQEKIRYNYLYFFADENKQPIISEIKNHFDISYIRIVEEIKNGKIGDGDLIQKWFKLPLKKEITYDWVKNKVERSKNQEKTFKNFYKIFSNFLDKYNLKGYPTSYGIGVDIIFRKDKDALLEIIEKELTRLNIEYKTEYSSAHWVFRYKISKKTENIEKLKKVIY